MAVTMARTEIVDQVAVLGTATSQSTSMHDIQPWGIELKHL